MTAEAGRLACPQCGASASPADVRCAHCATPLALVSCPACFARAFRGSRHCPACGAILDRRVAKVPSGACPRCRTTLNAVTVGGLPLAECQACGGVFATEEAFARLRGDAESQSAVLARPTRTSPPRGDASSYVPCPVCRKLMNRLNFARVSGVIIDACRGHGLWFDRDELALIVRFVKEGGLERAREHEKASIEEARSRLRDEERTRRLEAVHNAHRSEVGSLLSISRDFPEADLRAALSAFRDLWKAK